MRASVLAKAAAMMLALGDAIRVQNKGYLPPIPKDHSGRLSTLSSHPQVKAASFTQLIDHGNPSLGTFTQRYWYNAEFYAGPGSPVVLNAPGEFAADRYTGYTTNLTLEGVIAQTNGGAAIVLEHRYWGGSSPFQNLTVETLQHLTLGQAIQDVVYFANNVELPFDPSGSSKPDRAPWILSGGSYPGALTAWIHDLAPGTFWAYHASSAVVETVADFWEYFAPIDEALPRNCSADLKRIHAHVQFVLTVQHEAERHRLKSSFGLGDLADDDFVDALTDPLYQWQDQQFYDGYGGVILMCDWIEGGWPGFDATRLPGPEGVGLDLSLEGFAKFWTEYWLPERECVGKTTLCYGSHDRNSPMYTDTSVGNPYNRQWMWLLCNEAFEWWQVGSPFSTVGYPSQIYNINYYRRQCPLFFPSINNHVVGMLRGARAASVDYRTGGWNRVDTTRLIWVNGEYDPWRSATVASDFRPGGPFRGDSDRPAFVIPRASHCQDLIVRNSEVNEGVSKVAAEVVDKMKGWVDEFYEKNGNRAREV